MIYASPITTVGSTQVTASSPTDFTRHMDHAIVYNPGASVAYLSVWRSITEDRRGAYAIAPGQTVTIPLGLHMGQDAATLAAHANSDATGAPSADLEITVGWSA